MFLLPQVLRIRDHIPTPFSFVIFTFILPFESFEKFGVHHLVVMKKKYGYSKQLFVHKSKPILELDPILSLITLNMQPSLFKLTMQSNTTTVLQKPFQINPMTRM